MSDSYSEIFRPKKPSQLIGKLQISTATALLKSVEEGKIIQEVLFSGDSGIGKTTIAKMYISAVLGEPYEGKPFNCGDKTGVDYIREQVIGTMNYMPLDMSYRVYFLDEIHMITTQAQSSLLVAIEPVPKHVLLVCCTTQPEKLIPTLRSRLTEYHLTPPSLSDFEKLAGWISTTTKKQLSNDMRDEIIRISGGNVRQFVRFIQQALDGSYTSIREETNRQEKLARLLMGNQKASLSELLNAVDPNSNLVGEAIGLAKYAIAILKNPQSNGRSAQSAKTVLRVFGNRPAKEIDSDTTFFSKLLEVYESQV